VTGKIIFEKSDAVFADEGTYLTKLDAIPEIDSAFLFSASGGKHAPIIAKELKKRKKKIILITNNQDAMAKKFADKTLVFPKNPEPYTYNTSTYMGMILGHTKENPKIILDHLKKLKIPNFKPYDSFYIIVPEEFENVRELFLTKFDELFGSKVTGRCFTPEQTKHAKTVVPDDKELFIGIGYKNTAFGNHRVNFTLPKDAKAASIMAVGYYIIGHIQKQKPAYFKNNIVTYCKTASKLFSQTINPIVE
ncbi:MAG: hypothetical protein KJ922_00600, partial [Nanoarchaeota archaeon]|nr:hypothetical protein [Nanoarchaeota archaeon]